MPNFIRTHGFKLKKEKIYWLTHPLIRGWGIQAEIDNEDESYKVTFKLNKAEIEPKKSV